MSTSIKIDEELKGRVQHLARLRWPSRCPNVRDYKFLTGGRNKNR